MKRKLSVLLLCLLLLAGCQHTSQTGSAASAASAPSGGANHKLSVVSTIFPPYDFVRAIAGDNLSLTMLLPPGAESHSFEPTPQDIITIQNCDIFLYTGGESDSWITDILASMDTGNMTILAMMDMVEVKEEEIVSGMQHDHDAEDDHGHEDHGHGEDGDHAHDAETEYDEHVWTSPKNAKLIVRAICEALCSLDADHAETYAQNTAGYLAQLDKLNAAFEDVVEEAARTTLIFGDRFPFRYFADAYGLTYYAAFPGCSTETEPSAATVAFLIDKVREEDIPVVLHIELSNEKMADTICGETGAEKRLMHSCHNLTREEMAAGAGYLSLMWENVAVLKEALQ